MHDFLSSNELTEMQDFEVLMRNNRSTLLEGKENPINKRKALIEYTVHHWIESGVNPTKGNGNCSLLKTSY